MLLANKRDWLENIEAVETTQTSKCENQVVLRDKRQFPTCSVLNRMRFHCMNLNRGTLEHCNNILLKMNRAC